MIMYYTGEILGRVLSRELGMVSLVWVGTVDGE
jgi:hypothetical protein